MTSLKFTRKKETELFVLCIWLFLIRIAIPYDKYVFVPYFILFFAYTVITTFSAKELNWPPSCYIRVFSSFLVVCLFFITGVLLSSRYDFYFLKEGLAMLVLLSIVFMAFTYIKNRDDFAFFKTVFMRQLLAFSIFICICSLLKLFFLLRGVKFGFLFDGNGLYPNGTSLVIDYNFYALVNILGIVSASFLLLKETSRLRIALLQVLIFGLIIDVMFSTSRRGIAILSLILLFLFIVLMFGWLAKKGSWMAVLSGRIRLVFLFFFSFVFLMVMFLSQRPFHSKNSLYVDLGFDRTTGRDLLYVCAVRYYTIIEPQFKDQAMDRYFELFRKTGQVGEMSRIFAINRYKDILDASDSVRLNIPKEGSGDAYLNGILNDPENRFSGGRVQRINYGLKIFSGYSGIRKIFGGGFDYLWDFGHEFYQKNLNRFYYDYPHNPILSAFLYSGILGGLSLIWFYIMTLVFFVRSFRSLIYFACLYVIIFFFAFFSGNSIFGNPEFVLISLIPFFYAVFRYRNCEERPEVTEK
jgi:hypothetical protein